LERTRGRAWQAIRKRLLDHRPLCAMCQQNNLITPATQVDHIVPLFKGGTDDMDNLQPLCSDCHKTKTLHDITRKTGCNLQGIPEGWQ
jgi:5-methylcytosine-specific restriction enzyme A